MTHICVCNLTIIGSDNSLSSGRRQVFIWTNAGMLLIRTSGTNFIAMLIKIHTFSFKKVHLKILSGKCWSFCLGLNVLTHWGLVTYMYQCNKSSLVQVIVCCLLGQAINQTNDDFSNGSLRTYFSKILTQCLIFLSGNASEKAVCKSQPVYLVLNELNKKDFGTVLAQRWNAISRQCWF